MNDLVSQYEKMLAGGTSIFFEADSFQDLIDYYEEIFETSKALQVIEHALIQYPYSAVFQIRKAQLLLEEDRVEAANDALRIAKLYEPSNIDVILTEAEIFHHSGNYFEALEMVDKALFLADKSDLEDIYLLEATIFESQEDFRASFDSLVKVLKLNPYNELAFSRLWMCMELAECYQKGIETNLEIIDLAPYSYWAWYNLAHAYFQVGQFENSVEAYDYTIVINENFEFAYRDIINCLFRINNYELAKRYIEEYKVQFGTDAEVILWEGECYENQLDYDKARSLYFEAMTIDALDGRVDYRIGVTYASQNNWRMARISFEHAHRLNKESEEYCIALAEAYNQLDEISLAYSFYKKAILLAPEEMLTWISYLEFLIDEADYDTAFEILKNARDYSNDVLLDFCEAALNILSGARKEGINQFLTLVYNNEDSAKLFEIAPDLEKDAEIISIIRDFQSKN